MHRLTCVALVFAAACGGAAKSAPTMPSNATADGPSCGAMADHVIDLLTKGSPDAPPDLVKKIHDTLVRHCTDDAWTASSRTCFANMAAKQDGDKCEDGLSDTQKKALAAENTGEETEPQKTNAVAPGGGTRGPKKGGDPCDGGE